MRFQVILMHLCSSIAVEGVHLYYNLSHERTHYQTDVPNGEAHTPAAGELLQAQRTFNVTGVSQPRLSSSGLSSESHTATGRSPTQSKAPLSGATAPRVSQPNQKCVNDTDCKNFDEAAKAVCKHGICVCRPLGLCWHYQYLAKPAKIVYYCSTCGTLGSTCTFDTDCEPPGLCSSDLFCHCDVGENNYGACMIFNTTYEHNVLTAVLGVTAAVLYFILCIIAFRPDGGYFNLRCCRRMPWFAPGARAVERDYVAIRRARRGRTLKTQAFTYTERLRDLQSSEADIWELESQ